MDQKRPSQNQAASAAVRGGSAHGTDITPKQVMDILRRHVFLIISLTIIGAGLGVGAFFLLAKIGRAHV